MASMVVLALAALATARLTRMVTSDRLFLAPRAWLLRWLKEDGLTSYLVVCDWCVSVYVGAGVAAALSWMGYLPWAQAPIAALAFSYAAGFLAERTGE